MTYTNFKMGLEELLLAAQQVLRQLETYQVADDADRTDLEEHLFHAKSDLEAVQKRYEEDAETLDRPLMFELAELDKELAKALHAARLQVSVEAFHFYKHFQHTLHAEILRALDGK